MSPLFSGLSGVHRNDVVFEKKQFISSMQANFRGMYWRMRFGALMQREDAKQTIRLACRALEVVALDFFTKSGCRINNGLSTLPDDLLCTVPIPTDVRLSGNGIMAQ